MPELAERLEQARAEVRRLERLALSATCVDLGHDWQSIGGLEITTTVITTKRGKFASTAPTSTVPRMSGSRRLFTKPFNRRRAGRMKVAVIRNHEYPDMLRVIAVPEGQSLDFDPDAATRRWLHPYLGTEWHLVSFADVETSPSATN